MPSRVVSDGNLAFMPSSNDALGNVQSPPLLPHHTPFSLPRSSISSPTRMPPPSDARDAAATVSPRSGLNASARMSREQSASGTTATSTAAVPALSPRDDDWHAMYNQATLLHEHERNLWKLERQKLMEEIEQLRQQLVTVQTAAPRSDSVASSVATSQSAAFYNPDIIKQANEKLRQFSQVSPNGTTPTVDENVMPTMGGSLSRKPSGISRMPRITENGEHSTSLPRASFAINDETIGSPKVFSAGTFGQIEDPRSPPTTAHAAVLSPPPENFIRHAGHTPRIRSHRGSEAEPRARPVVANDGTDEDVELASPKVLARTPEGDLSTLTLLDKRLQSIAEDPDAAEHQPDAVRHLTCDDGQNQLTSATVPVPAEPDGGIRLKTRRSMNFGAPLGHR